MTAQRLRLGARGVRVRSRHTVADMTDVAPDDPREPRPRAVLDAMPSYKPGKPATPTGGLAAYKMSSNKNPYPPLPSVLAVVQAAAGTINRYPDMAVTALTEAPAESLEVPAECIATGTGSVGVLGQVVQAMCEAGDEVVYAWRSFEAYPIVCAVAGAASVPVPLAPGQRHDLPAMAAAVTERTRVLIVCTPNNPTGTVVRTDELEDLLAAVPPSVLVVIDEAYCEFMVLRTFSKAYGLAGLRGGYAVAHPRVAAALRETAVPFGVNSLAQAAGVASLAAYDELEVRVKALVAERERVEDALADQGWQLEPSSANFVWFPLGARSTEFAAACEAVGLMVRQYGDDGVRVTISEPEANDRLLSVTERFRTR